MIELNTFLIENAKTQKADPNDVKNPNFFPVGDGFGFLFMLGTFHIESLCQQHHPGGRTFSLSDRPKNPGFRGSNPLSAYNE